MHGQVRCEGDAFPPDNSLANACVSQLYAAVQAALATIWICVAAGTALGLSQRLGSRATDPIRSFAVVSAGLVALVVLLPHAVESEGLWGLVAGAAAFAAIPLVERLGGVLFRGIPARTVRLEVGFAGLLLHRFGDGVAMRVEGHGTDVLFALGAHEIPIVALVTLAYLDRGLATALLRAGLLGAASTLGCVAIDVVPGALQSWHGYADALAAGILWHIVVHELSVPSPAGAPRGLDVLGAALAGFVLWGPSSGEDGHGAVGAALLDWLLTLAPAASLGLLASAAIFAVSKASSGTPRRPAFKAPDDLRLEHVAPSFALLGWRMGALRLATASALAFSVALAERRRARSARTAGAHAPRQLRTSDFLGRLWEGTREGSARLAVWLALGAIVAAYLETFVPEGSLLGPSSWRIALAVAGLAVVARLSPAGATPIAAALMQQGLSPNAALAGLLLGLVSSAGPSEALRDSLGPARARSIVGVFALAALGVAAALPLPFAPAPAAGSTPAHAWAFLALITFICAAAMARTGVRGWLALGLGIRVAETSLHAHETLSLQSLHGAEREAAADTGRI